MKRHVVKALLAALAAAIVAWPTWVTSTLYDLKQDIAVIKQAIVGNISSK